MKLDSTFFSPVMGIDPLLHDGYPFVYIDGEKFFYGRKPGSQAWVVAHHEYGKWYFVFDSGQKMMEFLGLHAQKV